ncbi:MAG: nitroreductase family protein [Deltaproteobacteria bacterium]|nr:nitroreductase family protein [Candidatus Anaeroferrophillus wilburensis]MBN2890061.1 nitroreductase family protein [Deltaproteobacteria bacterium]
MDHTTTPSSPFANQTLETINRRHSTRVFADQPISEADLLTILQAANRAPSAHNQQSWRFIVIRGEKKHQLVQLVSARAGDFPRASRALLRMASRSIASAPVVIAVANTGELIAHGIDLFKVDKTIAHDFFRTMEIQSSAAAVQNLLLAATALGLSSVWLGILFLIKDDILQFLGEPAGEFMAVIPIGHAATAGKSPKKRPLEMIVKTLD